MLGFLTLTTNQVVVILKLGVRACINNPPMQTILGSNSEMATLDLKGLKSILLEKRPIMFESSSGDGLATKQKCYQESESLD